MKISVVIPAYNAAATIESTLKSCYDQSLQPYEVIVVDDAGTDNTVAIVAASYPQVKIISLRKNAGVAVARNTGWAQASGDIIAFLDSDDQWHQRKLEVIYYLFEKYQDMKVLVHHFGLNLDAIPEDFSKISLGKESFRSLLWNSPVQGSSICVKKEMPILFHPKYRYCEDHEWAIRVAHKYNGYPFLSLKLTLLDRPQLSAGGLSGNQWKMRKGEMKMYASLGQLKLWLYPAIPFLIAFSFLKFIKKQCIG